MHALTDTGDLEPDLAISKKRQCKVLDCAAKRFVQENLFAGSFFT